MILVAVGDFDTDVLLRAVEARFGAVEARALPPRPRPEEPLQTAPRVAVFPFRAELARLEIGCLRWRRLTHVCRPRICSAIFWARATTRRSTRRSSVGATWHTTSTRLTTRRAIGACFSSVPVANPSAPQTSCGA